MTEDNVNEDDTNITAKSYVAQLTITLDNLDPSQNVDKSSEIYFTIVEDV